MNKRKAKFVSLSTPGVRQDLSNYLVELIFLRRNRGSRLPPRFWSETRYKFRYMREIKACRKFIKAYGEAAVLHIARKNYFTTWTEYDKIEVLLQAYRERIVNKSKPKDMGSVEREIVERGKDLRTQRQRKEHKGLFQKLEELENG